MGETWDQTLPSLLLVTKDDLIPEFLLDQGLCPAAISVLTDVAGRLPLAVAGHVHHFTARAIADALKRPNTPKAPIFADEGSPLAFAGRQGITHIATPYAPTGPVALRLAALTHAAKGQGVAVACVLRDHDRQAWPHATHGFFRFRDAVMG